MSEPIYAGSTDQTIDVFLQDSSSSTGAGLTGLLYNSSGLTCYYRKGATGASTQLTLATQTVGGAHSDGGFVEIDSTNQPGMYRLDLSDGMVDTEGYVTVYLQGATNLLPTPIRVDCKARKVDVVQVSGDATAADNLETVWNGVEGFYPAYAGAFGPGVHIDAAAANTNTVNGVDGTPKNPVSTLTAARTLADSLGLKVYYIENNSSLTLAATHEDWLFVGLGSIADNVLNLGSQDVDRSEFINITIEGTQGGAERITAIGCALQDPGAGTTTLHILAERCGIVDDISLDTSNDNVFDQCFSLVAGTAAPIIRATGAAGTVAFRHYSGGLDIRNLSASHDMSIEGMGNITFHSSNNVNATVAIRGIFTVTDNAGMVALSEDGRIDRPAINAEADTALADYDPPTRAELTTDINSVLTRLGTPAGADISADIATVDANVDSILVDTGTTIPAQITALNDVSAADVNAQVDIALADYDGPTRAEATSDKDEILTRLGTPSGADISADIATVDANVDSILVDTGTTIPAQIAALNDVSAADVNAQVDIALADYDGPTRAEATSDKDEILTRLGTPSGADISADIATNLDQINYALTVLAGTISTAGTANETFTLTVSGSTYTAAITGLDSSGNRGGQTLSKV